MKLLGFLVGLPTIAHALGGGSPIMGGYRPVDDIASDRVINAAEHAMTTFPSLEGNNLSALPFASYEIKEAAQQVVAGINYKLTIEMKDADGACVNMHAVTVYDKFGKLSVTNFQNMPCIEDGTSMANQQTVHYK